MKLHDLLTSRPINSTAARVTSQAGAANDDCPLNHIEISEIVARLSRKQRLLKIVLGIHTPRQHKNVIARAKKRIPQYRAIKEPRALAEYVRVGTEIARMNSELAEMRRCRRFVAEAQYEHKAMMVQSNA